MIDLICARQRRDAPGWDNPGPRGGTAMEQDEARLRRAPVERFAGPEHLYNLAEIAAKLRAEPHPATNGHRQMTIAHLGSVALVLFDFESDGRLVVHVADGLVTIHALAGHVQVKTSEGCLLYTSP